MARIRYEDLILASAPSGVFNLSGDSVALILAMLSPAFIAADESNQDAAKALIDQAIREIMTPAQTRQIGEIYATISQFLPSGHLPLDGQILPRADYEDLWQVVPDTWKATLNIPGGGSVQNIILPNQTSGLYVAGVDTENIGASFGQNAYSLSQSQLPPHNHRTLGIDTVTGQPQAFVIDYTLTTNRRVWNSGYTENTGAGQPIDNRPNSIGVRWAIVATSGG